MRKTNPGGRHVVVEDGKFKIGGEFIPSCSDVAGMVLGFLGTVHVDKEDEESENRDACYLSWFWGTYDAVRSRFADDEFEERVALLLSEFHDVHWRAVAEWKARADEWKRKVIKEQSESARLQAELDKIKRSTPFAAELSDRQQRSFQQMFAEGLGEAPLWPSPSGELTTKSPILHGLSLELRDRVVRLKNHADRVGEGDGVGHPGMHVRQSGVIELEWDHPGFRVPVLVTPPDMDFQVACERVNLFCRDLREGRDPSVGGWAKFEEAVQASQQPKSVSQSIFAKELERVYREMIRDWPKAMERERELLAAIKKAWDEGKPLKFSYGPPKPRGEKVDVTIIDEVATINEEAFLRPEKGVVAAPTDFPPPALPAIDADERTREVDRIAESVTTELGLKANVLTSQCQGDTSVQVTWVSMLGNQAMPVPVRFYSWEELSSIERRIRSVVQYAVDHPAEVTEVEPDAVAPPSKKGVDAAVESLKNWRTKPLDPNKPTREEIVAEVRARNDSFWTEVQEFAEKAGLYDPKESS